MKKRLDILIAEKEKVSREKAQAIIMAGSVFIDGKKETKSGSTFEDTANIEITKRMPYVSRGGLKLEHAAREFGIDFNGKIVADVGASTGGFTDVVLQSGAKNVYAIDTGYGQIDQKLRNDNRVVLMEKTNIKSVDSLPEPIDIFVIDVSFISLKQVLPIILKITQNSKFKTCGEQSRTIRNSSVIALIKPQFEVGKKIADKTKGVIRDPKTQAKTVEEVGKFAESIGYRVQAITKSPITGAKGNQEFLIYLK